MFCLPTQCAEVIQGKLEGCLANSAPLLHAYHQLLPPRRDASKSWPGRLKKIQFEIFSADFIVDTFGGVASRIAKVFEFNMSPVLKDPEGRPEGRAQE